MRILPNNQPNLTQPAPFKTQTNESSQENRSVGALFAFVKTAQTAMPHLKQKRARTGNASTPSEPKPAAEMDKGHSLGNLDQPEAKMKMKGTIRDMRYTLMETGEEYRHLWSSLTAKHDEPDLQVMPNRLKKD